MIEKTIEQIAEEIRRASDEARERVTHRQLIDLITQIIESGDIHRYCNQFDTASNLVYIPGRELTEARERIADLEDKRKGAIGALLHKTKVVVVREKKIKELEEELAEAKAFADRQTKRLEMVRAKLEEQER